MSYTLARGYMIPIVDTAMTGPLSQPEIIPDRTPRALPPGVICAQVISQSAALFFVPLAFPSPPAPG